MEKNSILANLAILLNSVEQWNNQVRKEPGVRDLSEADLRNANLYGANLSKANLSNADLSKANLRKADLSNADLRNANFSEADLSKANLSGADLRYANFSEADLRGANLVRVVFCGCRIDGARVNPGDIGGKCGEYLYVLTAEQYRLVQEMERDDER